MNRPPLRVWRALALGASALAFAVAQEPSVGWAALPFRLTSPSFAQDAEIPSKSTCEGEDVSPALTWVGVPPGTMSLALVVDDPDAPDPKAPKTTWVHWVLYDIPPTLTALPEDFTAKAPAHAGLNDWKEEGYRGPCPATGRHRYFFKLYALDIVLPALSPADKPALERAMAGHIVGHTVLVGQYGKKS
jgi:Raf kinase inhibitor-like YbhB/YbcL family protein